MAKRYGIAVGRDGFSWSGTATVARKTKWPAWFPPKQMQARDREAYRWRKGMPGGPRNPLGARALYLFKGEVDTLFRIHGTRDPKSIGNAASSTVATEVLIPALYRVDLLHYHLSRRANQAQLPFIGGNCRGQCARYRHDRAVEGKFDRLS